VNLAVRGGRERLPEMVLAQPVARFVQRHCLNVNIPVDTPVVAVVVVGLAESDIQLSVVVNIGRGAGGGVNENEGEGDADDDGAKLIRGKSAGMSDVGEPETMHPFFRVFECDRKNSDTFRL